MCGLSSFEITPREREVLSVIRPAGVIAFAKNFDRQNPDWIKRHEQLLEDLRSAIGRERFFLAVDHEGGRVHRFPEPVTKFPAAAAWRNSAGSVGKAMGRELRALGFNLAFAPVLDVHNEPKNRVIGERAFGRDVSEVSAFAESFRVALEAEGVFSCGKHFPGHGRTTSDSHHELPVLEVSRAELDQLELVPFRKAINSGLQMIMTAHVHYPKIDPDFPATLSHKILTGILRDELNFKGVVISDDLEMKALSSQPLEQNGVAALMAGVDLLLVAHNMTALPLEDALSLFKELERRRAEPQVEQRLRQAAQRVEELLNDPRGLRTSGTTVNLGEIGTAQNRELAAVLRQTTTV